MQLLKLPAYISLGAKNVKIGEKTFQLNEQPKMSSFFKDFMPSVLNSIIFLPSYSFLEMFVDAYGCKEKPQLRQQNLEKRLDIKILPEAPSVEAAALFLTKAEGSSSM